MPKRKPLSQLPLDCTENSEVPKKLRKNSIIGQKRAGTIVRMVLKNFMCHSHLEVELNSNINYIIGRNGSGKSAILTALIVGLGARANVTNRGSSIKNFIKVGCHSASIEITLNNTGYLTYKPNEYGDQIIIYRSFTSNGNNSYKIKSATGVVQSTHATEVHDICLSFNIQIDNPICILNQDTSRNFLSTSDCKQKFILFMRATRLEELTTEYKAIMRNMEKSLSLLQCKNKILNDFGVQLENIKQTLNNYNTVISLREKLGDLHRELAWVKVGSLEEECRKKEAVRAEIQATYLEIEKDLNNWDDTQKELTEQIHSLQQQIDEQKKTAEEYSRREKEVTRVLNELKQKHREKKREQEVASILIEKNLENCKTIEVEIENFHSNLTQVEQDKARRLKTIGDLEQKIQHVASTVDSLTNDHFQIKCSIKRKIEDSQSLKRELVQSNEKISNVKYNLTSLEKESKNTLSLYGRDMPNIINAIEAQKHKFKEMPRGPIGRYIKVKNKKWTVAIEGYLSPAFLRSFCVDNETDNSRLINIFNETCRNGPKPTIITSKFFHKVHDISKHLVAPTRDCTSIYEALEIEDPVVANCVIDQTSVESVLLIPTTEKAIELMSEASRVPTNCSQGVTVEGDKYYPDPNYKSYGSRYHEAKFLQEDTNEIIRDLKTNLASLIAKKKSADNQYEIINREINKENRELESVGENIEKLHTKRIELRRMLDEMKSSADPEVGNIENLTCELADLKRNMNAQKAAAAASEDALKELNDEIEKQQDTLNKLQELSKELEKRIAPLEEQMTIRTSKKTKLNISKNFEKKRLDEAKNKFELAESEALQLQDVLKHETNIALNMGLRVETVRESSIISSEIKRAERNVRKIESELVDADELSKQYSDHRMKYLETKAIMDGLKHEVWELQRITENRKKLFEHTQNYYVSFIQHAFRCALEFRKFQGSLEIDIKEKTLEMVVRPQKGNQGATKTANLSGGERSFSTVAFLYSLWQCMEFPFYFLDEFDVFMDKINRAKVMEILIHHAKGKKDLQFVFLTPQDVSFIQDKDVAIHKLANPQGLNLQ